MFSSAACSSTTRGEFAGEPFEPEPWQVFIIGSLFGWKVRKTGRRRYRDAHIEIPRKNGKTFKAAVVGLYMLIADGESAAEVYSVATKKDQAKLVWKDAKVMARRSASLKKRTKIYHNSITVPGTEGIWEPLASDSDKLDGLNPHCCIYDELHAWKDRALYDVCADAMGARAQPASVTITTAGNDIHGVCFENRKHTVSILEGADDYVDDKWFGYIATVDEDRQDDWENPEVWAMANPNLGVSKSREYMEDQAAKAKAMPSKLNSFLNKQLNIWTTQKERWLRMDRWKDCGGEVDFERLRGAPCFAGLDLSAVSDITANVYVFPSGPYNEPAVFSRFYLPEDYMRERVRRDRVPYDVWARQGFIELTPGDVVDYEFIKADMLHFQEQFAVKQVGYDPWKAAELATWGEANGFEMVLLRQGHATLGNPTVELEKRVLRREIRHGNNPVLNWMAGNTAARRDPNDNIVPDKEHSHEKIDGIVALIMGLKLMMMATDTTSVYEERGLIQL